MFVIKPVHVEHGGEVLIRPGRKINSAQVKHKIHG